MRLVVLRATTFGAGRCFDAGSAIAMGNKWKCGFSPRRIDQRWSKFREVLPGCSVDYQANTGPHRVEVSEDPSVFIICSGIGFIMVATEKRQWAQAFPCDQRRCASSGL